MGITRRDFLHNTTVAAGLPLILAAGSAQAAPKAVRHAVIGTGGQGRNHIEGFLTVDGCEVVALCDVDPVRLERAKDLVPGAKTTTDFHAVLADDAVDSVSIVTPDHWHTPIALAALAAGKHVYVEKPCSHTIAEGAALLRAAEKSGLCVQHGTQSRLSPGIVEAIRQLREGVVGRVRAAKAINHQFREPIGRASEEAPPAGVDYDRWVGPAPMRPFTRNRWHYNWHWLWDFGCGDMANDGIHQVDVARWGLGVTWPKAVSASGGQLFYDDDHETPDTQMVTFEFDGCHLIYEMRLWTNYPLEGHDNGVVFYGDEGTVEVGRQGCFVKRIGQDRERIGDGVVWGPNLRGFIAAVREGDPAQVRAPMAEAAPSAGLCHLGNIATRVGRRLHFDAATQQCPDDAEATALFTKAYRAGYELPTV